MVEKKPVPQKLVQPLKAAAEIARTAHANRDRLIVQALNAGAGIRQVAQVVGLTDSAVFRIGKLGGWPTPDTAAKWKAEREQSKRRRAFESLDIEEQVRLLRSVAEALDMDP